MTDIQTYRRLLDRKLADYRHTQRQVVEEKQALKEAKIQLHACNDAQKIVQEAAQAVQASAHRQIAQVVNRCLKTVFIEDAYTFAIHFEKKRGRTEARFVLQRNGHELDPLTAAGGGVCDICSLALLIACIMLSVPRRRRLIVADEPLKSLHGDVNRKRVVQLIELLAKELDFQFIIATGLEWLRPGQVIDLEEDL